MNCLTSLGVVVRADPGLVAEVHRGALGLALRADRQEVLVAPALHSVGVGLPGPPQGPLRRQAQGAQQPTTLTADSDTRNSRRISVRSMSRVHSANPNSSCRGSVPAISV